MLVMAASWIFGDCRDDAPLPGAEDGVLVDVPVLGVELVREPTSGAFDVAGAEPDSRDSTFVDVGEASALIAVEEVSSSVAGFDEADTDKEDVFVTEGTPLLNVGIGPE